MSVKTVVRDIKSAGFGYIKVELEANLDRTDEDEYETCYECDGDGRTNCDECDGAGWIEEAVLREDGTETDETHEVACEECDGNGDITCSNCDGDGEVYSEYGGFDSEDRCYEFIMDSLSTEARKAIIFGKFYNDGSVDSEFTFTIAVEDAKYLPEIVDSFNKLAEHIGNGMDVDGAGMHIAVLPTESNGSYPVYNFTMPYENLSNFQEQVTKLLPALFLAATSGNFTREFYYREPKISDDKYSAIHIVNSSCLEFRLFETCYQRPVAIFEYLETIARCLEYYKDPSKKVKTIGKTFEFYDREGIKGLTYTPEQVEVIKKQIKLVIGKNTTVKSFAEKREISLSVGERRKALNNRIKRIRKMYEEKVTDYEFRMSLPLTDEEKQTIREQEIYNNRFYTSGQDERIGWVRNLRNPGSLESFISKALTDGMQASKRIAC